MGGSPSRGWSWGWSSRWHHPPLLGSTIPTPQVWFFHYIPTVELQEAGRTYWSWTSYTVERCEGSTIALLLRREYILLPGQPEEVQGVLLANSSLVVEHHPEEAVRLCRATPHCAGLSQDPSTGLTYSLEWIHFPLLSPHPTASTLLLLSTRSNQLADDDRLAGLDRCCPETRRLPGLPGDEGAEIARRPCTISPETFLSQHILRRVPVILEVQPRTTLPTTRAASPAPCSRREGSVGSPSTRSSTASSTGLATSRQLR